MANYTIKEGAIDTRDNYVAGNSGDILFATCFRQFMIFCAKFYFSAQMATMAIGNANPAVSGNDVYITRLYFERIP